MGKSEARRASPRGTSGGVGSRAPCRLEPAGLRHRAPSRSAFSPAGLSLKPTSSRETWGWRLGRDGCSLRYNSSSCCSTRGPTCQRCRQQSSPCWLDILSSSSHAGVSVEVRSNKASTGLRKRPLAGRPRSRLSAEVGCTM